MRSRSHAVDHEAAIARRLELLTSELAGVRDDSAERADSWVPHGHTRIRVAPDPDPDLEISEVDPRPVPPVARMPGRHASRRTVAAPSGWVGLVPDPVRGRVGVGAAQLAVVAVLAVVGLVATCWFLVRSGGHEVGAPVAIHTPAQPLARPRGSTAPVDTAAEGAAPPSASSSKVVVDVAGKVRRPGIAVLRPGARVVDAIRAAGGARPGVDLGSLNLAQVLTDGEQIVVGGSVVTPTGVAAAASGAPGTATLVDLNTADQTALESLPEVGPVTAQAIIAWRSEHGGFSAVSQLLDVDGIGDATLAKLTPYVTL